MIAATTGSILVLMKKNSTSRVLRTGRSESANAHGVASSRTRIVDTMVANAEFATYGQMPLSNTALYCERVGEKNRCGVLVYAWTSVLKDVITIHRTGKKNTMPTIQPTTPRGRLLPRFFRGVTRRGAALARPASAVLMSALVMPPAPSRRTR